MKISEPHGETQTMLVMGLRFYISSSLRTETDMEIPELYEFEFEEGKLCPRSGPLSCHVSMFFYPMDAVSMWSLSSCSQVVIHL
jgi:hypothetical protein